MAAHHPIFFMILVCCDSPELRLSRRHCRGRSRLHGWDTWYINKTQPNRNQPWYHVLVHDSGGLSTYVAHSNLKQDTSGQAIDHPRIGCYFTKLEDGRYGLKENHSTGACSI